MFALAALSLVIASTPGPIAPPDRATSSLAPHEPIPAAAPVLEPPPPVVIFSKNQEAKENLLTDDASIERLRYEREIEKKYGIVLLTMQQAFGRGFNELDSSQVPLSAPVRWSNEQLKLYDELFSHMPSSLYEPVNGKDLKLFQATFVDTECKCHGKSFQGSSGVIAVSETTDRELAFTLLIHEATHRLDDLTKFSLQTEVKGIIGDRLQELHTEQSFILENITGRTIESETILSLVDTDIDKPRIGNTNFHNHRTMIEGVAQLSEVYIKGYEQFMSALGPILDGSGESVKPKDASIDLSENFPKTQALYDLYKNKVFGEKEFDLGTRELIKRGSVATLKMIDDYLNLRKMLDSIEQNYGIRTEAEVNTISPGHIGEMKLRGILEAFPKDFYSATDGKKLTISIRRGGWDRKGLIFSKSEDRINLYTENIYLSESRTVIMGRSSITTLSATELLANALVMRKDAATGYKTRDSITSILGGEDFLNSPEVLYPELRKVRELVPYAGEIYSIIYSGDSPNQKSVRNSAEIVGGFGALYTKGWKEFNESLEPFLGLDKSFEIYSKMRVLFSGAEFTGLDSLGVPIRLSNHPEPN